MATYGEWVGGHVYWARTIDGRTNGYVGRHGAVGTLDEIFALGLCDGADVLRW